ncbi:hypothetical protein ACNKHM_26935 [Shigella sonnei]
MGILLADAGDATGGYVGGTGSPAPLRCSEGIRFEQNNNVVIQNDGTNGLPGPQMMKAVYDMARRGARDEIRHRCAMVVCSPEVDDENLPLKVKPGIDVTSASSVRGGALW